MLKGIDPVVTGDLLRAMSDMGHGDELVIVDGNYAAHTDARQRPVIEVPSFSICNVLQGVLMYFPLDNTNRPIGNRSPVTIFAAHIDPATGHSVDVNLPIHQEIRAVAAVQGGWTGSVTWLASDAFHAMAQQAYAIVKTQDPRHFACVAIRKGVLPDPAVPAD